MTSDINEDLSPRVKAAAICGVILSSLFFAGRVASRRIKKQRLDSSDYTLMIGMICGWGIYALMFWGITQGLGKHVAKLAETDPELKGPNNVQKGLLAVECLYVVSLASIKISFLLLYRSIFPGRSFRILTNVIGAIIIAWAIAVLFVSIFACKPVNAFWNLAIIANAQCINTVHFYVGIWVPNITTDVVILCLPQSKIWKLQVGLRSKIALALMFLLGSFVIIASIIRFTTLFQFTFTDSTFSMATLGVWTCVENCVAVASASMPVMRPLYQQIVPKAWQFNLQTKSSSNNYNRGFLGKSGGGKITGPLKYGNLGSRKGMGGEEFERLPDEENRNQVFAMRSIGEETNKDAHEGENNEAIMVTKTWDTRSGENLG